MSQGNDTPPPRPVSNGPGMPPLILIGMHRSGTTLVSRLLHDLGVYMGADQTTGTSESVRFRTLNTKILLRRESTWFRPEPMQAVLADAAVVAEESAWLVRQLASRKMRSYWGSAALAKHPPEGCWGWKDPRSTITLPIWLQLFPQARILHVVRNGVDVAASLIHRDTVFATPAWRSQLRNVARCVYPWRWPEWKPEPFASMDVAFELWADYLNFAERNTQNIEPGRLLTLRFEELLRSPRHWATRLADFAGLPPREAWLADTEARIENSRRFACLSDPELKAFYTRQLSHPWMQQFGYSDPAGVLFADTLPAQQHSAA